MKAQLLETPLKVEEGGGGGLLMQVERDKKSASHLELSLGISSNGFGGVSGDAKGGGGGGGLIKFTTTPPPGESWLLGGGGVSGLVRFSGGSGGAKRWFSETQGGGGGGYVDPWSLAGRQEKAVFEQQTHQKANHLPPPTLSSRRATPPVVGWPPVRTFRKNNLVISPPLRKPDDHHIDAEKESAKKKKTNATVEEEEMEKEAPSKAAAAATATEMVVVVARPITTTTTMFVKVNMEGYAVGRKIDLMAHDNYDSLSCALQKMFHNFLSVSHASNGEENGQDKLETPDYILLYEDNEGDRMLVGDVPWEMFISSVKRLYIAGGSKRRIDLDISMSLFPGTDQQFFFFSEGSALTLSFANANLLCVSFSWKGSSIKH